LRFGEVQLVLKVFVHRIDHPVAKTPKQKQRGNQKERDSHVLSIRQNEQTWLGGSGVAGSGRWLSGAWRVHRVIS
jgi:hypothetical protein